MMAHGPWMVAFQQDTTWSEILTWSGVLIGIMIVGVIIVAIARRSLTKPLANVADGFTLHGLRELHASGQISREEYDRARAAMIARVKPLDTHDEADPAVKAVRELRGRSDKPASPPPAIDGTDSPG